MHKICVHILCNIIYVHTAGECATIYHEGGDKMAYTEAGKKAADKYRAAHIKRVPLDMQITEYEQLKAAADARGERVNEYIKNAIRERMSKAPTTD